MYNVDCNIENGKLKLKRAKTDSSLEYTFRQLLWSF